MREAIFTIVGGHRPRLQLSNMNSISIRALNPDEWAIFRDLRLHALKSAPGVFATAYDDVASKLPEHWRATIQGAGNQVFGLFDDDRLIGITAVFTWNEDPLQQTALLAMSFILPEYRRRGLARLLYEARLEWIRAHPQFRRVVVSHRASNEASRRAMQQFGFVRTGSRPQTWPDGDTEDEITYELCIEG